jgi:PBP1b-binding outer membrane lipoprotein LpoB
MNVKNSLAHRLRLLLFTLLITGCVTAPVQEMSDARQALQAARQAGAEQRSPELYEQAQTLLEQAQKQLELGDYREARDNAVTAKHRALDARADAMKRGEHSSE